MKEDHCRTWKEFETLLEKLNAMREKAKKEVQGRSVPKFLFRGQGSDQWRLESTLDHWPGGPWSFSEYFRLACVAQPQIETFTNQRWDLKDWPELNNWAAEYDNLHRTQFPGYDYLTFLRHNGFPSPLLDWTRSAYFAAYFAFARPRTDNVTIYIYWEHTGRGKTSSSNEPQIKCFGPYVRGHTRHFLQQSQYTIAAQYRDDKWWYASHEDVFAAGVTEQDRLWKCTLPATERKAVLQFLDTHNVNAFSLFQSDEALLETIALRETELRG